LPVRLAVTITATSARMIIMIKRIRVGTIIGVVLAILAAIYFYFVLLPRLFPVS
jgi:hypothetical protein